MAGNCKYYKREMYVSMDSGQTWSGTGVYSQGALIESASTDCGYVPPVEPQYRDVSGTPYCSGASGYDKYVDVYSQVSYDSGSTWETTATTPTLVEANSEYCHYVPPTPPHDYSTQYLTFRALEDAHFKFQHGNGNTIYYSLDSGSTWTWLSGNTWSPTIHSGETIMWSREISTSENKYCYTDASGRFEAEGNIMSFVYGNNFSGQTSLGNYKFNEFFDGVYNLVNAENLVLPATTLPNSCYSEMFRGCSGLTTAPELPATTLTNSCYYHMFDGCTSLTTAPELPATTLAYGCYNGMFHGCSSLTTAPTLSATTLASYCYSAMFDGCSSLTTAPTLSATTLATGCYSAMFDGCTSLTTAPELPATTLGQACYASMFYDCSSLTTAPTLSATTLAYACYQNMFYGCTSLNSITCLATNISATDSTTYWLYGVAASGTFTTPSSTQWSSGSSGIPQGWTRVNI